MRLAAFDYDLPPSLIAQRPLEDRAASRLMVVDRATGSWEHSRFERLPEYLDRNDVLVVNRSRVLPARLFVSRPGGGRAELLFSKALGDREFLAVAHPLRKLRAGDVLRGLEGPFECRVIGRAGAREVHLVMISPSSPIEVLERHGHVPLPPYIARPDETLDRERYQTVFADESGSVAAPTAGLHFTPALVEELRSSGVEVCSVVLHVGPGTFLPLDREVVEENRLHPETYAVSGDTLRGLGDAKRSGRRVVAVGTTVTRVLESLSREGRFDDREPARAAEGETDLFVHPGYEFGFVDRLVTNFHLPRSSLLLLVCAFLGADRTMACYREAVRMRYRFYSYGDAMLIR